MHIPKAKKIPFSISMHGEPLTDNYHWLRDNTWPDVKDQEILNHLNAENAYCEEIMAPLKVQEDKIYDELLGRIKLTDQSVPYKIDDYYYYHRTTETSNYPISCRRKKNMESPEEIILDGNVLAKGKPYFNLGALALSPDHNLMAYSTDITGGERYTIFVKNFTTDELLSDQINGTLGTIAWHQKKPGFFYTPVTKNWRTRQIYYHELGTEQKNDVLLFEEKDTEFHVSLSLSADKQFLIFSSGSKTTTESWFIDIHGYEITPQLFLKRKEGHLYDIDHHGNHFYIKTNDKGRNFRLARATTDSLASENWEELIECSEDKYLTNVTLMQSFFAVERKENGLNKIIVLDYGMNKKEVINFPEPAYSANVSDTPYKSENLRLSYSSLISPPTVMDYDFSNNALTTLKVTEIPSGFDKNLYSSKRIMAPSLDGTMVPISLFYRIDKFKKDGDNPAFLYGYGSYGYAIPACFRSAALSLVDRGFVYSIAHIRGGDDLGFGWYEDAKFLNKRKTFDDFIACAKHLCNEKYTTAGNIAIAGGSAGGMLMGVAVNEAPELFKAALALVPFVDVLNTMLDESLPLTPGEFKEWGNPKEKAFYNYIKSYSPYDNVKAQKYPALYVTAGLSDPRVTYWEPAKWVAKLRELKTDDNILFSKTYMTAGHAGAPGRFGYLRDIAQEYNFIFKIFGINV